MYCAFSEVLLFASSNECVTFSKTHSMQCHGFGVVFLFCFNSSMFIFVVYDSSTPSQTMAQATLGWTSGNKFQIIIINFSA